ncbi:ATP cone domain-containing protein [Methanobacterium sp.]|uniref:ATP cone domain-containing protein n=1 Tax=Methanobacterium sp. TaxID=2164 RepID=UPI003C7793A2
MIEVVKRDGKKEPFSEDKVRKSIEGAVKDAGIDIKEKSGVIAHATGNAMKLAISQTDEDTQTEGGKIEIRAEDIRNQIVNTLENEDSELADVWKNYEKQHGINY